MLHTYTIAVYKKVIANLSYGKIPYDDSVC